MTIPDSVISIGEYAFFECTSLTSVTLGDGVTEIGGGAFFGCSSLTSFTVSEGNLQYSSEGGVVYNKEKTTLIQMPVGINGEFTIPDGVTSIEGSAFYECASLTSITIPDSVTSIGNSAFYNCTSLKSITIPDSVTGIGLRVFQNCTALTSVTIGDGVTSIGYQAFQNCTALTSVTIGKKVTSIGNYAFLYCYKLVEVWDHSELGIQKGSTENGYVGDYAKYVYTGEEKSKQTVTDEGYIFYEDGEENYLLGYTGQETELTLPAKTPSGKNYGIYQYAFYECALPTSVTIGDGVTEIGYEAFASCPSLTSVTIGDGVTSIGYEAFASCASLTSVMIGDGVISIGAKAFLGCASLTSLTIGGSVTSIGYEAFRECTSLTNLTIPDSVTEIGVVAFYLTGYYNDVSNWAGDVLYIGKYLIMVKDTISGAYTVQQGTKVIANHVFEDCDSLTGITIPDSVISIGDEAFSGCEYLTSVTIGDGVTSIGERAFAYCNSLTTIEYGGTVAEWQNIQKGESWDYSGSRKKYTITCTDGTIDKYGNVTMFDA